MTFLILQIANAALAALSLWIHFKNPNLLDDQAWVYSVLAGCLLASLTAVILGFAMVFGESKGKAVWIHLLLTLAFAGVQLWLLYAGAEDLGILQLIKSTFSGSP